MISNKYISGATAVLMAALVLFTLIYTYMPSALPASVTQNQVIKEYASTVFDEDSILSVDIQMDEAQWTEMLENAISETYSSCDVTINGTTYKNVAIRPKGNTSLSQVASDDTTDRFSFKIKFDYYVDGQTCDGLDSLTLNNLISDASYMKEYFAYDMFQYLGVASSLYSFADISLNGETWGLYLALETPDSSFLERNYGTSYGQLYKPETMEAGGMGGGNGKADNPDGGRADGNAKAGGRGGHMGSSNSNLAYISDDTADYSYIFDNTITDGTEKDQETLIEALKNISNGTDLEAYLNIDQMLRYMAVNVFLVNLDSYFGNMLHNYLLYEEDGQICMLPWDYNLAFAGFQSNSAEDAVNLAIDTVVSGASLEDRPLLYQIMQVPEYVETYHIYLKQLISGYFDSGYFEVKLAQTDALITSYVASDPTAFYTHEEYQTAVNALKTFCQLRSESIHGQLDGTLPSTSEEQAANPDNLVDTADLRISDMGTQGGGGTQGGRNKEIFNAEQTFGQRQQLPSEKKPEASSSSSVASATVLPYLACFVAAVLGLLFARFYRRR